MGRIKEIYMEIYDKFNGEIPEGYTFGDYVEEVNENKKLQEYSLLQDNDKND